MGQAKLVRHRDEGGEQLTVRFESQGYDLIPLKLRETGEAAIMSPSLGCMRTVDCGVMTKAGLPADFVLGGTCMSATWRCPRLDMRLGHPKTMGASQLAKPL